MAGDQPGRRNHHRPAHLLAKPRWQRLIITFAGPLINVVLAVVLLTGLFMQHFRKYRRRLDPVVGYVAPDGAAAKAGIQEGDRSCRSTAPRIPPGTTSPSRNSRQRATAHARLGERGGETLHLTVTPILDEKQGVGEFDWTQEIRSRSEASSRTAMPRNAPDCKQATPGERERHPLRSISALWKRSNDHRREAARPGVSAEREQHQITVQPAKATDSGREPTLDDRPDSRAARGNDQAPADAGVHRIMQREPAERETDLAVPGGMLERRMSPKSIVGPVGSRRCPARWRAKVRQRSSA